MYLARFPPLMIALELMADMPLETWMQHRQTGFTLCAALTNTGKNLYDWCPKDNLCTKCKELKCSCIWPTVAETYAEAANTHAANAKCRALSLDNPLSFRALSHEQAALSRMPDCDDAIFSSFMKTLDFVDPSEYPFGSSRSLHACAMWAP